MGFQHNLFIRDVGNITTPATNRPGYINASHLSNLTVGWTPSSLPTPYSIVIASSIVSLIVACIGFKTALMSWVPPDRQQKQFPEGFKNWGWRKRLQWSFEDQRKFTHRAQRITHAEQYGVDLPDGVAPHERHLLTMTHSEDDDRVYAVVDHNRGAPITKWKASTSAKFLVLIALVYNTVRAVFAITIALQIAINHQGTHAAVSSLFLFYLSLQTFTTNRTFPRLINFILVINLVLVAAAFLITQWDWRTTKYGDVVVFGGNCPVFAENCTAQAPQWTKVGCGAAKKVEDWKRPGDLIGDFFHPPYPTEGSINTQKGQNKLKLIESLVGIIGTGWVGLTILITVYETFHTFGSRHSLAQLLWPIPLEEHLYQDKKTGKLRRRTGWSALGVFAFFGFVGTFIVTILSIIGHMSAEKHTYTGTYIDGFGSAVNTIVTYLNGAPASNPVVNSTQYWGNETNWSDCFTATTPSSSNGFLKEWVEYNKQQAYRFVVLL